MRRLSVLFGAAMLLIALAAPVAASSPTNATIILVRDSQFNEIGWSATGSFSDSGSWTSDFRRSGALPSPVAFQTILKTTETSALGTFRIEFQGHFNLPAGHDFGGTWVITQGTGAYAAIQSARAGRRGADLPRLPGDGHQHERASAATHAYETRCGGHYVESRSGIGA